MVGRIVADIVKPTIAAGGADTDIMVMIESVVLGVLLFNERAFDVSRATSAEMIDSLATAVAQRLAEKPHGGHR
jgi:hypothetical protein